MKQLLTLLSLLAIPAVNAQWTQRTSPTTQPLYAVQFVNDTGYAVGYYGTVIRSTDRGLGWAAMPFPNSGDLHDVYFHDALHGFAAGDSGLFHTVDGGLTWGAVATPLQEPWLCVTFVSPQVGFCGGGSFGTGALLRTLDGGATWAVVFSGAEIPVSAVQFPTADTGYAIQYSYSWEFLKSTDGGANWTTVPIGPISGYTNLEGLHFLDADNGYAGGWYLPAFIHTVDGGLTWSEVVPGGSMNVYAIDFTGPQQGIAVGTYGAILHTYNGIDWADEAFPGTTEDNYAVDLLDDTTAIVVGGGGQVLRWSSATAGVPAIPTMHPEVTVHPSPATDWLVLESGAPLPEGARFELRDGNGTVVFSAVARPHARMELGDLAAGNYVWRCAVKGSTWASGKVVLAR
ncbi:MAG: WD40/YVTN/BNR-like repeat-containing protein [Flavobacteriales bacterium]